MSQHQTLDNTSNKPAVKPREIWIGDFADPATAADAARRREDEGFTGMNVAESQNRYGDSFIALAMAATATTTLKLGTAVTNPVTRHPAVMACAIGSIQVLSSGRATLGIGAGDSALAYLGVAPAPLRVFERYVLTLHTYLMGGEVPLEDSVAFLPVASSALRDVEELNLGDRPRTSRMEWLPGDQPVVPVNVWATGPKTIDMAARAGDQITLAVGADPARVAWAIERARAARAAAGGDPDELDLGASIQVGLHDDLPTARKIVAGMVATNARFAVMHGRPTGPLSEPVEAVLRDVHQKYDMRSHSKKASAQVAALTDEFIDYYGVVGPPSRCRDRLTELFDLGVRRMHIGFYAKGADPADVRSACGRFGAEVIPGLA